MGKFPSSFMSKRDTRVRTPFIESFKRLPSKLKEKAALRVFSLQRCSHLPIHASNAILTKNVSYRVTLKDGAFFLLKLERLRTLLDDI